jgi:hypothetical protein
VKFLWSVTEQIFTVETNKSCGLHVHLSVPDDQNWPIDRLQQLCRSAFWFENALEALCPESRRGNKWAKSNRLDNPKLKNKTERECFDLIDQCKHHVDVMNLMNNGSDRYFAWNFTNLQYSHKCTVEWRRGPGVADPETYLDWVELVVAFAGSAMKFGTVDELKGYSQDVEGLKEFINNGLVEKLNEPQRLKRIFGDISGAVDPIPVGTLSPSEREQVEKKAKEDENKNIMVKKILKATAGK